MPSNRGKKPGELGAPAVTGAVFGGQPRHRPRRAQPTRAELLVENERLRQLLAGSPPPPAPLSSDRLETVRVPPALEPLFLRAQEYVSRYFAARVENPRESTITISGERYVLLRAASLSVEFVELVTSLYRDQGETEAVAVANNLLFDLAHALGRADARCFHEKMGVTDPIERLSAGPVHFSFAGWAFVDIHAASRPSPDEEFVLLYDHPFSFESQSWLSKGKRSRRPVCIMNAGYSSGWCEESFGLPLVAAEIECVAAGGERCRFIMAPPSRIEERLAEHAGVAFEFPPLDRATGVMVPEFFQRKRMEDALRSSYGVLERRVEERTAELLQANQLLLREIAERRQVEERLRLLGTAVENAFEGILVLAAGDDGELRVVFANRGFRRMSGRSVDDTLGAGLEVLGLAGTEPLLENLRGNVADGRPFQGEAPARRRDGGEYSLELHLMPVDDTLGQPSHWVAVLRDVSDRRAQLAELEHRALHDPLTDLPNRLLLFDRLGQALLVAGRTRASVGLLFLDLDNFKDVNDRYGHACGDALLGLIAPRLRAELRAADTISRLGGDEFAVVLPLVRTVDDVRQAAAKLIEAMAQPFMVEDRLLVVGASIGIVLWPEHGDDAATLIRRADEAMYQAKQTRSGYRVFGDAGPEPA